MEPALREAEVGARTDGAARGDAARGARARLAAGGRRAGAWLSAHPAAVIGAMVLLGTLLSWRHTRLVSEWIVMTDELQYMKLSHSFAEGSFPQPTLRGEHHPLLSVLYPLLISPFMALFSAPTGYELSHLVGALLIASTAVPVYLLAREVIVQRALAYLAAALAVAVPWAATSAIFMTEAAAYPAFAWALLAIQRAVVEPSWRRDLLALAAIGLAFYARTQFLFLVAVFPAVIVLHESLWLLLAKRDDASETTGLRLLRDRLRSHAVVGALVAFGLVLVVLPDTLLATALGPFQVTVDEGGAFPAGLGPAMRTQLAYVAGGVGFLPLALAVGWALASLLRPVGRDSHALALLALVAGAALVYIVAVFGLRHAAGPLDRYLFYLAPLLILPTVACLAQGRSRPIGLAVGAATAFWLLHTAGVQFVESGLFLNSQASEFHRVYQGQTSRLGAALGIDRLAPVTLITWGILAATAATWLLLHRVPRLAPVVVGVPLLLLALAQTDYVSKRLSATINSHQGAINSVPLAGRDWIDEAVAADGDVALAPSPLADSWTTSRVWWNVEFWNKRVNRALVVDGFADYAPFPGRKLSLDRSDDTIRTGGGGQPRYIVFGRNQLVFRPQGRTLAEHKTAIPQDPGLELLELRRPYRPGWIAEGGTDDGWISHRNSVRIRVFPRDDGRAQRLTVRLDLPLPSNTPSRFVLRHGAQTAAGLARGATIQGEAAVALCLAPGRLREAQLSTHARHRLPDGRTLGVHLQGIRVEPAVAC